MPKKERLDIEIIKRGLSESREQAQRLILSGKVSVNGNQRVKPGSQIRDDAKIELLGRNKYVSRGGEKIEGAIEDFKVDIKGKTIADIGSSTGGFTDFVLKEGACEVFAIDVGRGQLDQSLRKNPKVTVMERMDIRRIESLPEKIDIFLVDVSFLSIKIILNEIKRLVEKQEKESQVVALVKPQFEVGKRIADKYKGVIKDKEIQESVVEGVKAYAVKQGFLILGEAKSKIKGQKGNQEYFLYLTLAPGII